MRIAIIGTGNVGGVLGRRLANAGHAVVFGSREPLSERVQRLIQQQAQATQATSISEAADEAELVILATPYDHIESAASLLQHVNGKPVVDCSNPINASFDGLRLGFDRSAAEHLAALLPRAHVVKAFNTASVATMDDPLYDGQAATMFYCGDDRSAKQLVHGVIEDLTMEPVDSGPLRNARYLEPMAMLYIHLAVKEGWGGNCALKMLRR